MLTSGDPRIDRILQARALELARVPDEDEDIDSTLVVEFSLGDHKYGIEAGFVKEVRSLESLTQVPCTPEFVAGIINLRGTLLSLIDLRRFLDIPIMGMTDLPEILVVGAAGLQVGVVVHEVLGLRLLAASDIKAPLPNDENVAREYVFGVTPDLTVLLNAEKIFSDERLVVHEEVRK